MFLTSIIYDLTIENYQIIMPSSLKSLSGVIILVIIFLNSCSYSSKRTNSLLSKAKDDSFDMIIVPGIPFNGEQWSDMMRMRVCWSKYLFDRGIAKNIIYSGSAVYTPYV